MNKGVIKVYPVSAVGNPVIVTDHLEGVNLKNYQIHGNSIQEGVGKNLIPYPYDTSSGTRNGLTLTVNDDGTITLNGTLTATDGYANFYLCSGVAIEPNVYFLSGIPSGVGCTLDLAANNTTIGLANKNGGLLVDLSSYTDTVNVDVSLTVGADIEFSNVVIKPQLEIGTEATEYIKYGTPSPEYPIEIQSVGDLITDETSEYYGKYDVPVVIHGKNLFDTERWYNELYASETSHTGDYAISKTDEYIQLCAALGKLNLNFMEGEFETNTQYSISMQIMNVTANNTAGLIIKYTDGTVLNIAALKTDTSWKDISVVTSKGKTISCIVINSYSPSTVFRIKNIQLEKGTTATSYEPYASETEHIYLDEPLRKVGDYADYVDFENQKVIRQVEVLDDTGTKTIDESLESLVAPTEESITVPELTALNTESITAEVTSKLSPSKFEITYYQDINKVLTNLTNAILAQGGNV